MVEQGLSLPDGITVIYPGNKIVLGRFSSIPWIVNFGWFSYEGNRKICGWYLEQVEDSSIIKPIQETDLYDIYIVNQ